MDGIEKLMNRVRREVDEGLLPSAQVALARGGEVFHTATIGDADDSSLYCIFSATKAITSSAAWLLIQDGRLDIGERVSDIVPEFAPNGKDSVRVDHLFTHTAGFPHAPFKPTDWADQDRRYERFGQWRLYWQPGERFEYHPTSSMWVIAEIIERRSGQTFQSFVRERIAEPLNLTDLHVGVADEHEGRCLDCEYVGEALTAEDYERLGIPVPPVTEVTEEAILRFNRPDIRAIGVPGGGAFTNAPTLAQFYQALLTGGLGGVRIWHDDTLAMARRIRSDGLRDPVFGKLANRALGIIVAGDDDRTYRGFGKTNSPDAFGHNGAGGQLAWADPQTGLSLAYLTNGHDRNNVRQARRGVAVSSLATAC